MKTIYIDSEYKCHVTDDGTMTAVETEVFDGKCDAFIEGYRFVPEGETWTQDDGEVIDGEAVMPFKDSQMLETVQSLYEETTATAIAQEDNDAMLVDHEYRLTLLELGITEEE